VANAYHDNQGRFTKRPPGAPNPQPKPTFSPYDELGRPSATRYKNQIYEDFLPELTGRRAIRAYREMSSNDPTVGAVLFAIEMLLRRMTWNVEPWDDTPQDTEAADFLDSCRDDMSHTWADHMAAACSMLPFGWSYFELVYKQRKPGASRFPDGRVGWRKLGFRPQDTLERWEKDDDGSLRGMVQKVGNGTVLIPIEKAVLYQVRPGMGEPESRSVLRNAYRPWYYRKRAEEIMLVGLERNLAGLPVLRIPAASIIKGDSDPLYARAKLMAQRLRQDEQMGVVWPSDQWEGGGEMYGIGTLPTPGAPGIDPIAVVRMFATDIATTVLADFISLGRDTVGSRALADPKVEIFTQALGAWADSMEQAINRYAVPRLFALNSFNLERLPEIKHGPVEKPDLDELGNFVLRLSQAGADWGLMDPADPIGDQVRQLAGFDPKPDQLTKQLVLPYAASS
jgi:hypothetical protein